MGTPRSLNAVYLMGNVVRDPQIRTTRKGIAVGEFPLATFETWTDSRGRRHESKTWHDIVAWDQIAESLIHVSKGDLVLVEGRLLRDEHGPTGNVQVRASRVTFLPEGRGEL